MIPENKSVRKQILITESLNNDLKAVAESKGISANEIINRALSAYLKRFDLTKEG